MGTWKIIKKEDGGNDVGAALISVCVPVFPLFALLTGDNIYKNPDIYTVKNEETDETKQVSAWDKNELGKKISEGGDFLQEDE